ncbi:cytochrome P450 [Melanogaster broomeanus]|nr:cytochrome P450 [Melanogaster broomeanus]
MGPQCVSWRWPASQLVHAWRRRLKAQQSPFPYPLPPGPPPLPIVGNVRGINVDAPWLTYSEWSKVYGDLVYSRFLDQAIIIVNSEKIARDLFERRSSNYSDRPILAPNALFGLDFNTILMPYGERWRLQRRFFHQSFKAGSVSRFVPMQQRKAHQLLSGLLESPDLYIDHLFEYASAVIMNSVYDYDPIPPDDRIVEIVGRVCKLFLAVMTPGVAGILGAFPILLNLPSWFPGMSVKRKAVLCREWAKDWVEVPFQHALQRMTKHDGSTAPSMVFDALRRAEQKDTSPEWSQGLKDAAATAFAAGSETSSSALTTFLLAMVLHPEVQAKAQAQIDAVVGRDRLPTCDDRPSLTYIDAIMRETLRWNPVFPLSLPHAVVNDDIYDGYHIPKGAILLTNLWSMAHDESKYPRPCEFIPERFLNPDGTVTSDDVLNIAFGFGRRICVGRHFADITLWSAMAMILALFKVSVPKDEDGKEVAFEPKWATGLTRHPLPFPCSIVPRIPGMDASKLEEMINANA